MRFALPVAALLLVGCSSASPPAPPAPPPPAAMELGTGDKSPGSVTLTAIATAADELRTPTDLDFNPRVPGELWITNLADNSVVIVHDATSEQRRSEWRWEQAMMHFLNRPMGIAFGAEGTTFGSVGTFGTCGDSRNEHGSSPPNDFTGPALWTSDLSVFARQDPFGLGSHIDMLHSTPLCMGIAHERANVYWVFGGQSGSIQRYDFAKDHDVGQDDHSDGSILWYATGQVQRVEGVPSHLVFHEETGMVFACDTGHSRVVKLDPQSGARGKPAPAKEPLAESAYIDGATVTEVVGSARVTAPSGIAIRGPWLYVSDNATGRISAFTLGGEQVNYLDTGLPPGSLGGIAFGPDGKLYIVDMLESRVLRIDPK